MFKTATFLKERFQTPKGLLAFLAAYHAPTPNDQAVYKWFSRGAVPSEWLPVLLAYCEIEDGQPISLIPYLGSE